jgi:hypothetical protein
MSLDFFDFNLDNFDIFSDSNDSQKIEDHLSEIQGDPFHFTSDSAHQAFMGDLVGNPQFDSSHFHQQSYDNTCAIVAQQGILESHGIVVSENDLMQIATENGWFSHDGTLMKDMGGLLEYFGIDVDYASNATIHDLVIELSQGDKVIVGLDASEIWTPQSNGDISNWYSAELPDQGHAVWITGIDIENGVVYMNDSGIPNGAGRPVALNDFINAWEDFGNNYCTTA